MVWVVWSAVSHSRFEVVTPPDGQWGGPLPDGTVSGMIGQVARREAHLAICEITISGERAARGMGEGGAADVDGGEGRDRIVKVEVMWVECDWKGKDRKERGEDTGVYGS